jgi:hypothetical protein
MAGSSYDHGSSSDQQLGRGGGGRGRVSRRLTSPPVAAEHRPTQQPRKALAVAATVAASDLRGNCFQAFLLSSKHQLIAKGDPSLLQVFFSFCKQKKVLPSETSHSNQEKKSLKSV